MIGASTNFDGLVVDLSHLDAVEVVDAERPALRRHPRGRTPAAAQPGGAAQLRRNHNVVPANAA